MLPCSLQSALLQNVQVLVQSVRTQHLLLSMLHHDARFKQSPLWQARQHASCTAFSSYEGQHESGSGPLTLHAWSKHAAHLDGHPMLHHVVKQVGVKGQPHFLPALPTGRSPFHMHLQRPPVQCILGLQQCKEGVSAGRVAVCCVSASALPLVQ